MSSADSPRDGGGIFAELFKQMASEPEVKRAWIVPSHPSRSDHNKSKSKKGLDYDLVVHSTQRDFVREAKTNLLTDLSMRDDGQRVRFSRSSTFPQAMTGGFKGMVVSPSGKWRCILRGRQSAAGKDLTEFEFWDRSALVAVVDVTELHGKVMLDNDQFGHLAWSPCETFVVYSAERTASKVEKESPSYNKYDYKHTEDWGEQLSGVSTLRPFVIALNPATSSIGQSFMRPRAFSLSIEDENAAGLSLGQPVFAPGLNGVVVTAWPTQPRRLGLVFCQQRKSYLLHLPFFPIKKSEERPSWRKSKPSPLNHLCRRLPPAQTAIEVLSSEIKVVSPADVTASSPHFSHDTLHLAMLIHDKKPTHGVVKSLAVVDWSAARRASAVSARTVVPFVRTTQDDPDAFPGIFSVALPSFCWSPDDSTISFTTQWGCTLSVVSVSAKTPKNAEDPIPAVRRVTAPQEGSAVLFGNCASGLLICSSQPSHPPSLRLIRHGSGTSVKPVVEESPRSVEEGLDASSITTVKLVSDSAGDFGFFVARRGGKILVSQVPADGAGAKAGLQIGDQIVRVNRTVVAGKLKKFVRCVDGKTRISLGVTRNGKGDSGGDHGISDTDADASSVEQWAARTSSTPFYLRSVDGTFREDPANAVQWEIVRTLVDDTGSPRLVEGILLGPASASNDFPELSKPIHAPLILYPHGGPHSGFTASYQMVSVRYLVSVGFAVLMVNYRGSSGYGSDSMECLLGKCGTQDVQDCVALLEHVLSSHSATASRSTEAKAPAITHPALGHLQFSRDKLAVYGGSHGGFLTAHLIGQYPDLFQAAAMRNPVTHIPSMVGITDIPDWCFVETGHDYDFDKAFRHVTETELKTMHQVSPLQLADRVKCPVLISIGLKDRRVPPPQGTQYYHALLASSNLSNENIRMNVYPKGNHSLRDIESEAHLWPEVASWLKTYVR